MSKKKYDWPGVEYGSAEYYRLYRLANLEKMVQYARDYNARRYETHKEQELARRKRWLENNADKTKAHRKVRDAVRGGKLTKLPCSVCNRSDIRIDAHHPDYSKPLEVIWLCGTHHHGLHKQLRDAATA